jgi:chitinase
MKAVWASMTYRNLGITPMIGQNDSAGEIFSWDDSQTVLSFAKANGIRRLAFWNLNRDQSCAAGETLDSCSEVNQAPLDYTDGFLN